jgi:hypothetical protein
MPPQRLPIVNSDDGTWGDIIRQYLMKEHYNDDTNNAANGGHHKITIRAGTASAGTAPLKFTTGTLLSTPEAGAMEFAGDNFYLTQTSSSVRKKIAIYDDGSGATGDIYYRNSSGYFTRLAAGSNGTFLTVSSGLPAWTSTIGSVSLDNTSTVTLKDTNFTLQDDGDVTKQMQFQLSGISTGTTRTLTVPNSSGTLYVTGGTDVSVADGGTGRSTNTTAYGIIAAGTTATGAMQTISPGSSGQFLKSAGASALGSFASLVATDISDSTSVGRSVLTAADAAAARTAIGAGTGNGDVTLTGAQTLTNKTLTSPVINGTVTGSALATAATANLIPLWDSNKNLFADNFIATFTTTATAAGTTTLTVASTQIQVFTGTSTQTVRLPTTSVVAGTQYRVINNSTGAVTVQSSGANTITILAGGSSGLFTALQATPTTAAHWDPQYWGSFIASGKAFNVSNSLTLAGTDGTTMTFPNSSDTVVTLAANQTLTNKTINASNNSLSNITVSHLAASAVVTESEGISSNDNDTTLPTSAAVKDYADGIVSNQQPRFMTGTISTATGTSAKTVTLDSPWSSYTPVDGDYFRLTYTGGSSVSSPTLSINGTAAAAIMAPSGQTNSSNTAITPGAAALYLFNGTNYILQGATQNTTYSTISDAEIINTSSTSARLITGQRAETLMANEATVARTLTNKTITDPKINSIKDNNGSTVLDYITIASAANQFYITNQSAGNYPTFGVDGSDTNIGFTLAPKGSGPVRIYAVSGASPTIDVAGPDTNLDINLIPKGTGTVKAGGVSVATVSGSQMLTNKNLTSGTNTFPTFNQNTTGNAATATTATNQSGGTVNATTGDFSSYIRTDELRNISGTQLVLNAGESHSQATGQTGELIYLNAEGGVQINSSPDNWSTNWAGRVTTTINDTGITWNGNTVWHAGNDGSGSGLDADTVDGQQASDFVTLNSSQTLTNKNLTGSGNTFNASNLTTGTVPDARLSGTYSGFTHKIDGSNTVFTTASSGSTNTLARTVYGLAEYRSNSGTQVGAIVFYAPNTNSSIMHQLEISGLLYNQNIVQMTVQGYRTTGAWSDMRKISTGTVDVQARWGVDPSGKNCLILGDIATSWSYPHLSIVRAMFSHTNASDSYSTGWSVGIVTDLTGFTQVSSTITDSAMVGSVSGNAATATTLQTARTIQTNLASTSSSSFNGSANITPGVTGTLPVGNGGTGATTLTGLVKGNGTSAMTVAAAGTDYVTPSGSETLANKTLTTPTIASFTNATHNHTNAAGGGQLTASTALSATGTPSSTTYLRGDNTWATITASGDASTNTTTSVDGEVVLFNGTTGKSLKRATGTGIATLTSGVLSTTSTTGSGNVVLATSPTITTAVLNGTVTGTSVATAATANLIPKWDTNKNLFADNFIATYTTTVTSGSTVTLTVASTQIQVFTGSTAQTVTLPTTSIVAGTQYRIINNSSNTVTVNASGGTTAAILAANTSALVTALQATPTTNAHWDTQYWGTSIVNAKKLTVSNSLTFAGTDGTTMTFPNGSDTVATLAANQTLTNKTLTSPRANSILDTNGNTSLVLGATGSAVNYLQLSNATSGNNPIFYSQGASSNIGIDLVLKGTGNFTVYDASFGVIFGTNSGTPGSNTNYLVLKPGTAGNPAALGSWGTDTNVGIDLQPKGAGTVTVNGSPILSSADIAGKADVKNISSGTLLTGSNFTGSTLDTHPESGTFVNMPHMFNDLAYNNQRGGSVVWTKNGSGVGFSGEHNPFYPDSTFASGFSLSSTSNTIVAEVTTHKTFNWGTTWGIVMTPWICARNVTIEVWDNTAGSWNTAYTATNDTSGIHWVGWSAPSGNDMTKVRYTLTNFISSSDVRITQLFAVQFNSPLLSGTFLPRGGGQLYGDLQVPAVRTSLLRDTNNNGIVELYGNSSAVNYLQIQNRASGAGPGVYAQGSDTNIDIDLIPKGSGRVKANNVTVPTISSSDTLTNKNLTSGTNTFPTFNQNTTGSAATLTTTRTLQTNLASTTAANFNGSANASIGVTGNLPVANGGTGRATSTTAYGIIAAGTTATGVQQTISPGSSGQFLKSAGASALASFASITATDISDSTATGRSVLTAASASAARSAIGAGSGDGDVTLTGAQTLTNKTLTNPTVNNYTEGVVAIGTVTTSNTLNLTNGTIQTATLTANTSCTFTMPTAVAGKSFVLMLKQAASTGNGSAAFSGVKWNASGAPTVTATAGKMDIFNFFSDGSNWYGSYTQGYTP